MWMRYSDFLTVLGGAAYRNHVFTYIDREDSPRPITYQLELLRKVRFTQVELLSKDASLVAFGAIKER